MRFNHSCDKLCITLPVLNNEIGFDMLWIFFLIERDESFIQNNDCGSDVSTLLRIDQCLVSIWPTIHSLLMIGLLLPSKLQFPCSKLSLCLCFIRHLEAHRNFSCSIDPTWKSIFCTRTDFGKKPWLQIFPSRSVVGLIIYSGMFMTDRGHE